jgi:hypothetical protein
LISKPQRIGLSLIANKVSDLLLSPKTTLPALLNAAGAPVFLTSLLVPIREAGALLPQMYFAKLLSNYPKRHIAWRIGMLAQLFCSVLILIAGLNLEGLLAGVVIIVALSFWSISRALCSLTNKDIQGIHVKKGERGKLIGAAASISSFCAMIVALGAWYIDAVGNLNLANSAGAQIGLDKILPIGIAALLAQSLCLVIMWPLKACVDAPTGESEKNQSQRAYLVKAIKDPVVRHFIIMRSLLAHSALLAPVFTLAYSGGAISILAFLIISQALSGFLSSFIWGNLADRSALLCMKIGAVIAAFASLLLLIIIVFFNEFTQSPWVIVSLFFFLGIGYNGIRTGRKIYSIDISEGQQRTEFVAITNTLVGAFILIAGVFYSFLLHYSMTLTLAFMLGGLVAGLSVSFFVKKEK